MASIGRRIALIAHRNCTLSALTLLAVAWTHAAAQLSSELPPQPQITVSQTKDGLAATIGGETLHVSVCAESVIHVVASPIDAASAIPEQPWMLAPAESCPGTKFDFSKLRGIGQIIHDTSSLIEDYAMLVKEYHHLEFWLTTTSEGLLKAAKK